MRATITVTTPGVRQFHHKMYGLNATFNEEQPLPSRNCVMVDLEHTKGDQTTKCTSKQRTAEKEGNSKPKFATGVEQCKVEHGTSEKPSLKYSEEESNDKHASKVRCCTLEKSHGTPTDHHCIKQIST